MHNRAVGARCHYIVKIGVDSCGLPRTRVDDVGDPKWMNRKGLLPEVSRNHHVRETGLVGFESLPHRQVFFP